MATPAPGQIPSHELVVFVGHASDARDEADIVKQLESTFTDDLRRINHANDDGVDSVFTSVKVFAWNHDALGRSGGQEEVISPWLRRTNCAVFLFNPDPA